MHLPQRACIITSQATCPALGTKLMMEEVKIAVIFVCAISCIVVDGAVSVSVSCMMAYDEGSAPAVFHSPECTSHWVLNTLSLQNRTTNCHFATLQGHREYQEDRISCNLDMNIPFLGKDGPKESRVGVFAVFDGHGGKEASEMASKYLLDYFFLHVVFGTYKQALPRKAERDSVLQGNNETENRNSNIGNSQGALPEINDVSIHGILKEALPRAVHDIDTKFTLEALDKNYISGSTMTAALLLDGELLVANLGDSKALMCSERPTSHQDAKGSSMKELYAEELSRDHHPDREDEKARIKAVGGFVRIWGVPRVNGILAVSRSIGDVNLKRYGVIAVPEIIGWRRLSMNDSYLIIASDGVFEGLTPQNVCDLLDSNKFSCLPSSSLADCIVNTALRKGSMDNLSAIVVPLKPLADSSKEPAEAM